MAGRPAAAVGFFRQIRLRALFSACLMISSFVRASICVLCLAGVLALAATASAQTNHYTTNAAEYAVIGSLVGDQVFPDVAVATNGGFVVWQDNATDGDGWGVSARRVDGTLSAGLDGAFRVNQLGAGDQENARVALLKNGAGVFVWQGGLPSRQHIYARFMTPDTNGNFVFLTATDLLVSVTGSNTFQANPAVAVLNNSNVVVVWSSFNQAGPNSLQDVYAKILTPAGATYRSEFLVNQVTNFNQRTPAVAALKNGGFVITWVSEQERTVVGSGINQTNGTASSSINLPSVDIYARLYPSSGAAANNEFLVNVDANPCANPSVAAASDGGFMVAWSGRDLITVTNGWDVYARPFSSTGIGGTVVRLNSYLAGAQYAPRLSAIGLEYLGVWTSMKQDGSREGAYGQFVHNDGTLIGGEFRINTTTVSQQLQPVVASDGVSQFIAVWTSYVGNPNSFDLFAQRYIDVTAILQAMSAPFVYVPFTLSNNVYQPQIQVSWPSLADQGYAISNYSVYVDGISNAVVTTNQWVMTALNGLTPSSTHSFQVDYLRPDGKRSPISPSATGTTWSGSNWGGVPYEWMVQFYGVNTNSWPPSGKGLGAAGMTASKVFLSGGNPTNSSSWLQQQLKKTSQGIFLNWNAQLGATYQVQVTTNLSTWSNYGSPQFAVNTNISINVGGGTAGYYRVTLLRQ